MEFKDMLQVLQPVLKPGATKPDFVCFFFDSVMNIDEEYEEDSNEHLFSSLKEGSTATKVFNGTIPLSQRKAERAFSLWNPAELEQALEDLEYHLVDKLIKDLSARGLTCNQENYVEQISNWIYDFLKKTAHKKAADGPKSKPKPQQNSYYDRRTQVVNYGPVVNQFGANPVHVENVENLIIKRGDKE